MSRAMLIVALPLTLMAANALAQAISPQTTDLITKAAATDAFERDAGALAQKRSAAADVRAFGALMVKDHTMTTDKLKQVLMQDRLPAPKNPSPDPAQAKMLADLRAAPKASFDRAYIHSQVVAHQQALMLLQTYAMNGDNADLKKLAADTVPLVQHHLDMALKLEGQVGTPKSLTRKED